jgi:hypothetical protein
MTSVSADTCSQVATKLEAVSEFACELVCRGNRPSVQSHPGTSGPLPSASRSRGRLYV